MLPQFEIHHRHGSHVVSHAAPYSHQHRRRALFSKALQSFVVLLVLLPLLYIASDRISSINPPAARGSGWSNRRALAKGSADSHTFPAARLQNLVLVAGHAVYTGAASMGRPCALHGSKVPLALRASQALTSPLPTKSHPGFSRPTKRSPVRETYCVILQKNVTS